MSRFHHLVMLSILSHELILFYGFNSNAKHPEIETTIELAFDKELNITLLLKLVKNDAN